MESMIYPPAEQNQPQPLRGAMRLIAALLLAIAGALCYGIYAVWGAHGLFACLCAYLAVSYIGLVLAAKRSKLGLVRS